MIINGTLIHHLRHAKIISLSKFLPFNIYKYTSTKRPTKKPINEIKINKGKNIKNVNENINTFKNLFFIIFKLLNYPAQRTTPLRGTNPYDVERLTNLNKSNEKSQTFIHCAMWHAGGLFF